MSGYNGLTTQGRMVNTASHRVWTGSQCVAVGMSRVVKSPQIPEQTTLTVPEPRIVEFYAH